MQLTAIISVLAILPAIAYCADKKAIKHLQWNDCGNENATVNLLTLDVYPVPVEIPGDIHINGVNVQSSAPLNNVTVQLTVERKIFIGYIPVPCLLDIGSCSYDVCSIVNNYADQEDKIPDFIYNGIHFIQTDNSSIDDADSVNTTEPLPPTTANLPITTPTTTPLPSGHTVEEITVPGTGTHTPVEPDKTTMPEVTMAVTPAATASTKANFTSVVTMGETTAAAATEGVNTTTTPVGTTAPPSAQTTSTISPTTTTTPKIVPTSSPTTTPKIVPTSSPTTTPKIVSTTSPTTHRPYLHLSCPLQPISFNLDTPYTYHINKLPSLLELFAEGDYKIKAQILSEASEELGCFQFNVTIKKHKEPGSKSGWFFRKRRHA